MSAAANSPADAAARQRAVELLDENVQLVAGAGAGKTETVSKRIAALLTEEGVRPEHVVAFTFTEKAAAELKERIALKVEEGTDARNGLADLYVGTIHAFCLQLLQQHDFRVLPYRVLDDVQQRLFISRNSRRSGLADFALSDGRPWHRYHQAGTFAETMAILREADVDRSVLKGTTAERVLEKYEALLDAEKLFDYTSILSRTVELLENDAAFAARVGTRIRYLTVDEYQDVNPVQERLIRALVEQGARLCVVGDDDQMIYGWRGSRLQNITTFGARYDDVHRLDLVENFRSSRGIVDLGRTVVEKNAGRMAKALRSYGNQDFDAGDVEMRAFDTDDEEANFIVDEILGLLGTPFEDAPGAVPRGLALSDMAILLRVRSLIPAITRALDARDVPYVVGGVSGLFDTREAHAARILFLYLAEQATEMELHDAWKAIGLVMQADDLKRALTFARKTLADKKAGTERFGFYNLQRAYLGFLERIRLREDAIAGTGLHDHTRGEIVYYNLGKFSQVISDFEQIYFQSNPEEKYRSFAGFLKFQADGIYPEGWLEARYVKPNAVEIMTIHQAKGLQWPVVFVPGLVKGRFPSPGRGGASPWSVIPAGAVRNQPDYATTEEDERRLFYVACTRAQKYLRLTRGVYPTPKSSWRTPSPFWDEAADALTDIAPPDPRPVRPKLDPQPLRAVANVALSFSELKYAFECPYSFKLRFLYGFNPPIDEALGQGKGLHDALFELHDRALNGGDTSTEAVEDLIERHLNLPFAYESLREKLVASAAEKLHRYIVERGSTFAEIEHAERPIEIDVGDGIHISGRIDLIRRKDTDEVVVIDFKSNDRTQAEDVTDLQLKVYALGYQQATGQNARAVVVTNLDDLDHDRELAVTSTLLEDARSHVLRVGGLLRDGHLPREPRGATKAERTQTCKRCDLVAICRDRVATTAGAA